MLCRHISLKVFTCLPSTNEKLHTPQFEFSSLVLFKTLVKAKYVCIMQYAILDNR